MATPEEIEHFFEFAKTLTLEAAEVIKRGIEEIKVVETKANERDLVTECDREVERILFENLSKEFPNHKFIGEETSALDNEIPELTDAPTWIIDPIDGTTNFVHSLPQICISIGLAINKIMEIGIIYNPCYDEMYTAKRGQGAFLNGKPIKPSSTNVLRKSLVVFEMSSISSASPTNVALARLQALINGAQAVRCIGSAALSLAYVARGSVDVFHMNGLKPWDVAAGFLIVTEAGGTVIDTKGISFDFMAPQVVAASNQTLAIETSQLMVQTGLKTQWKIADKK